jgi:ribosomal 30S subunit maturation factor RimM
MAASPQDLVGREVYARDDTKMGTVKELVCEGEYCVVRRSVLSKLVVPVKAIESSGDRLLIPLTSSYLDMAPKIDTRQPLSEKDRSLLDDFFMPHAA